jgi:hypothetical protein
MPIIPVNRVVDKKRINPEKWRAEERHELTPPPPQKNKAFELPIKFKSTMLR